MPSWSIGQLVVRVCTAPLDLPAHGAAIGSHIFIVLFKGTGKTVMSCGIGHEIIVVTGSGMHGGFEGTLSWITDGPRRKTDVFIGVIGRVEPHVGVVQS